MCVCVIDSMYGPETQQEMAQIENERDANTASLAGLYAQDCVSSMHGSGSSRILKILTLGRDRCQTVCYLVKTLYSDSTTQHNRHVSLDRYYLVIDNWDTSRTTFPPPKPTVKSPQSQHPTFEKVRQNR